MVDELVQNSAVATPALGLAGDPFAQSGVAVVLENCVRRYGKVAALDNLNIEMGPGELVCLLGPSGCGKTTALRAVAGLERLDGGRVVIGGNDVTTVPTNRRGLGMVFQAYSLFPNLSALDNVAFGMRLQRVGRKNRRQRAGELLELVGLNAQATRFPHELSGGQQQRVALARALAVEPRVLLLDEPLSALDARVRAQLRDDIRRIQLEVGITTLFVTHDQEEALSIADRVGIMDAGRLQQIANPAEIYEQPANAFVAQFVGNVNVLPGRLTGDGAVVVMGIKLPLPIGGPPPIGPGVEVMLRPEAVSVRPDPEGTGRITGRSFLGSTMRIAVSVADLPALVASVPAIEGTMLTPGTRVTVRPIGVPLFVAESDRALAPRWAAGRAHARRSEMTAPTNGGSTSEVTIRPGPAGPGGYRRLLAGPPEDLVCRIDLGGFRPSGRFRRLSGFAQLSDLHVTDAQSPARAEFLDRYGDLDLPSAAIVGRVGRYRPQETLTAQVVEAMNRSLQRCGAGAATLEPLSFAVVTGDATDNSQANELEAYLALVSGGGPVDPDSGRRGGFDGVGTARFYDARFWHPDGTPLGEADDRCRAERGFPTVPGLLDASLMAFGASGVGLPWYAVYGNHDALIGGTLGFGEPLSALVVGGRKPIGLGDGADVAGLLAGNETGQPSGLWGLLAGPSLEVPADPRRRLVGAKEWIAAHRRDGHGHGFSEVGAESGRAYYGLDDGPIRYLVLDTVNRAGGWQGSIDAEQFEWIEDELVSGHRNFYTPAGHRIGHGAEDRLFVLVSHHPLETLVNGYSPDGSARYLAADLITLIGRFPNVVLLINGHNHENAITALPTAGPRATGLWQVTTASHIDWPQQSRLVELVVDESTGDLLVATSMIDHAGAIVPSREALDDPLVLAGWSRELAANAWQRPWGEQPRDGEPGGRGSHGDRNALLVVPPPFRLRTR